MRPTPEGIWLLDSPVAVDRFDGALPTRFLFPFDDDLLPILGGTTLLSDVVRVDTATFTIDPPGAALFFLLTQVGEGAGPNPSPWAALPTTSAGSPSAPGASPPSLNSSPHHLPGPGDDDRAVAGNDLVVRVFRLVAGSWVEHDFHPVVQSGSTPCARAKSLSLRGTYALFSLAADYRHPLDDALFDHSDRDYGGPPGAALHSPAAAPTSTSAPTTPVSPSKPVSRTGDGADVPMRALGTAQGTAQGEPGRPIITPRAAAEPGRSPIAAPTLYTAHALAQRFAPLTTSLTPRFTPFNPSLLTAHALAQNSPTPERSR